ncbi:MAG: hypothetical protein AUK31_02190 [Fibrobacteres bacterium CG2_30_45_31]|nr:MAG: hypothetical protein AUK31_02190 [Fibrobacteres bacterium CG2_30_45_31]
MVRRTLKAPSESIIADGFGRIDYVDSYSIPVGRGESVDRLGTKIFCNGPLFLYFPSSGLLKTPDLTRARLLIISNLNEL